MKNCDEYIESISAYQDGELSASDCALVEEHLKGCVDCRATLEFYNDIAAVIKSSIMPAPETLSAGVMSAIAASGAPGELSSPETGKRKPLSRNAILFRILPAAACLVLLLLTIPTFFSSKKSSQDRAGDELSMSGAYTFGESTQSTGGEARAPALGAMDAMDDEAIIMENADISAEEEMLDGEAMFAVTEEFAPAPSAEPPRADDDLWLEMGLGEGRGDADSSDANDNEQKTFTLGGDNQSGSVPPETDEDTYMESGDNSGGERGEGAYPGEAPPGTNAPYTDRERPQEGSSDGYGEAVWDDEAPLAVIIAESEESESAQYYAVIYIRGVLPALLSQYPEIVVDDYTRHYHITKAAAIALIDSGDGIVSIEYGDADADAALVIYMA